MHIIYIYSNHFLPPFLKIIYMIVYMPPPQVPVIENPGLYPLEEAREKLSLPNI